jgi:hypothetical protein
LIMARYSLTMEGGGMASFKKKPSPSKLVLLCLPQDNLATKWETFRV